MGYHTEFRGKFTITPPLVPALMAELNAFSEERHDSPGFPGIWCDWHARDASTLAWNGAEKFYNYVEWLNYVVDRYLKPNGHQLNGEVTWHGEDHLDVGKIRVVANKVTTAKMKFVEGD